MTDARTIIGKEVSDFCDHIGDVQERPDDDMACDDCRKVRDAIIAALSAQGLVIVPREPTKPMVDAVEDWAGEQVHNRFKAWWRAAIAAATPPGEARWGIVTPAVSSFLTVSPHDHPHRPPRFPQRTRG